MGGELCCGTLVNEEAARRLIWAFAINVIHL